MQVIQPGFLLSLAGLVFADSNQDKATSDVDSCFTEADWKPCIQQLHADAKAVRDACRGSSREKFRCRKRATKRKQNIQKATYQMKKQQQVLNFALKRAGVRKSTTTCPLLKRDVASVHFALNSTIGNTHQGSLKIAIKRGDKRNWYVVTTKDKGGVTTLKIAESGVNVEGNDHGFKINTEAQHWDQSEVSFDSTLETGTPNDITWWYCMPQITTTVTTTTMGPAVILQSRVFTTHLSHPVDVVFQPMSNIDQVFAKGIDAALSLYLGARYRGMNISAGTHYENEPTRSTQPPIHECPGKSGACSDTLCLTNCPQNYEAVYKIEVAMLEEGHENLADMFTNTTFMGQYFDKQIRDQITPLFQAWEDTVDAQGLLDQPWTGYFTMRTGDCKCQSEDRYFPSLVVSSTVESCRDGFDEDGFFWGEDENGVMIGCEYCSRSHNRVPTGSDGTQYTCERPAGLDDLQM